MALEQKLSLKLAQKLVMTPSLQQAIKLLQMTRMELQNTLTQELVENPVVEEGEQEYEEEETPKEEDAEAAPEAEAEAEADEAEADAELGADAGVTPTLLTLSGSQTTEIEPLSGSDCRPAVVSYGGSFLSMPCRVEYVLTGSGVALVE